MEFENLIWQISFIALIAGMMIGALAYRFLAPSIKQADKVKSELDEATAELNNYKAGVTEHFDKTAELVNDLAQNYVKVYQHLADGAQTLGASKSFKDLMEQRQGKAYIAVDDQPKSTEIADEGLAVEPVIVEEDTVKTPADFAEPATETNSDGAESVISEKDTTKADEPVIEAESADIENHSESRKSQ